ncbi:MAG TPA: cyclase family protein [Dehalococcoidia bacterium]|nr:cyclase family protein [Dehalococcoidia bacterium]
MEIFDISVPISKALPTYEGDPPIDLELWHSMARGDLADVRTLDMGVHSGTHLDAPSHFIPGGRTIDQVDLDTCYGPAQVLDLTAADTPLIGREQLAGSLAPDVVRVLLKTKNSGLWTRAEFDPSFVALAPDAAQYLVERGVRVIGIDYLSIAPFADPTTVHRVLLAAGVVILEGLNLSAVPAGHYTLACFPLRLAAAEAAPARAILIT